jgi:hypothetical protein
MLAYTTLDKESWESTGHNTGIIKTMETRTICLRYFKNCAFRMTEKNSTSNQRNAGENLHFFVS